MELIENKGEFISDLHHWNGENLSRYPWVTNVRTPFTPVRRALPMLNLALISSAGAYINGTEPFDTTSKDGDLEFREFPIELEAADMDYAVKGFEPNAVREDRTLRYR